MQLPTRLALKAAHVAGYLTSRLTPEDRIEALIKRLRPVETDKPLIRIGGQGDGGYLLPDDLDGIQYCFSPGVSSTSTFEEDLLNRGIKSFLADYSVESPPETLREYTFDKKFVGAFDSDTYFTLQSWMKQRLPHHDGDLVLQMDIEGSEYPVLLSTPPDILRRFRIVVVEFHALNQLFNADMFGILHDSFYKLLEEFRVVHIHPNNCQGASRNRTLLVPNVMEFTFLRKDRIATERPAQTIPHPLDRVNVPGNPDVALPAIWYR